ncbi:AsmA-like C-terminal domain-containing protein [Roseibium sp.]|uniref:AsmA-like C-terminal domain-containing protein n=1 Tax=Roseibium sp. TaxID=1936156 RepID=UPI003A9718E2
MSAAIKAGTHIWRGWSRRRRIASSVGLFLVVCIAVLGVRLMSGPVHLPMFARFMAEQASRGPAKLTIVDASIDFAHKDGIRVVVREAHLRLEGEVAVEVLLPRVEAPLDGMALLAGKIHFESLVLDRPKIVLGVEQSERELPEMSHLMEAIDKVADVVDLEFSRRNLEKVEVANGEVEVTGALARSFRGIDATVRRRDDTRIDALARVAGRVGPWQLQLTRRIGEGEEDEKRLSLLFREISLGELLDAEQEVRSGKGLGLPLSVRFDTRFENNGAFKVASLVTRASDGWFQLGRSSVRYDDVALALEWVADRPGIEITTSHAIYGNTQIFFSGSIQIPEEAGADWTIDLATERAQFGSSDIPLAPMTIDGISIDGRIDPVGRTFFFDEALLKSGPSQIMASGSVELRADGPYIAVAVDGKDIPYGLTKQVWPITLVPPARRWIIDRIHDGRITHFSYQAAVRPPAFNPADPDPGWSGNDMTMELQFQGAEIEPVGDVPRISGVDGTVTIADEILTVRGSDGIARTEDGSEVEVPSATFKILNLRDRENKLGVLDVDLVGDAGDLGEIVDREPFRVLERADVSSDGVSGPSEATIHAEFPMRKQVDLAEVDWWAEAVSKSFTASKPIKGHTIAKGNIRLQADRSQLAVVGKGVLDGLPADINLLLPLGGSKVKPRQGVVLDVSADQLKQRGIDLTAFLDGPMVVRVVDLAGQRTFEIDLEQTRVRLDALGWEKAPNVPATVRFVLDPQDDGQEVRDFRLLSDGVEVAGNLSLSSGGDLVEASFSRFRLRAGDNVSLTIQRGSGGKYKVAMSGEEFDARGLIRQVGKPRGGDSSSGFSKGLAITANVSRLKGFNDTNVEKFTGILETDANGLTAADVTGMLNGRAPFSFEIEDRSDGAGRNAIGAFDDAGAMLKFLNLYDRMRGGQGQLQARMESHESWEGTFGVRSMSITEDPAIRKLREQPGLLGQRDQGAIHAIRGQQGGEASFETLDIAFVRQGDRLTITKGALQGAVIGGTVTGDVDLKAQTLDLTGTFVPIYALNNIFAKIPILGFALGGGSQEGLIGVTYKVSGPLGDPVLSVNPISAIAPGIFRKMFEFN